MKRIILFTIVALLCISFTYSTVEEQKRIESFSGATNIVLDQNAIFNKISLYSEYNIDIFLDSVSCKKSKLSDDYICGQGEVLFLDAKPSESGIVEINSYYNKPQATLDVFGTEYDVGDNVRTFLQLLDNGEPLSNASCFVDIWYPDNTVFKDFQMMTYLTGSDGLYYYDTFAPSQEGVYMVNAECFFDELLTFHYPFNFTVINGSIGSGGAGGNGTSFANYDDDRNGQLNINDVNEGAFEPFNLTGFTSADDISMCFMASDSAGNPTAHIGVAYNLTNAPINAQIINLPFAANPSSFTCFTLDASTKEIIFNAPDISDLHLGITCSDCDGSNKVSQAREGTNPDTPDSYEFDSSSWILRSSLDWIFSVNITAMPADINATVGDDGVYLSVTEVGNSIDVYFNFTNITITGQTDDIEVFINGILDLGATNSGNASIFIWNYTSSDWDLLPNNWLGFNQQEDTVSNSVSIESFNTSYLQNSNSNIRVFANNSNLIQAQFDVVSIIVSELIGIQIDNVKGGSEIHVSPSLIFNQTAIDSISSQLGAVNLSIINNISQSNEQIVAQLLNINLSLAAQLLAHNESIHNALLDAINQINQNTNNSLLSLENNLISFISSQSFILNNTLDSSLLVLNQSLQDAIAANAPGNDTSAILASINGNTNTILLSINDTNALLFDVATNQTIALNDSLQNAKAMLTDSIYDAIFNLNNSLQIVESNIETKLSEINISIISHIGNDTQIIIDSILENTTLDIDSLSFETQQSLLTLNNSLRLFITGEINDVQSDISTQTTTITGAITTQTTTLTSGQTTILNELAEINNSIFEKIDTINITIDTLSIANEVWNFDNRTLTEFLFNVSLANLTVNLDENTTNQITGNVPISFEAGSCPESQSGIILIGFILLTGIIFVFIGLGNPTFGVFGSLILITTPWYIASCIGLGAYIITVIGIIGIIFFALRKV